MTETYPNRLNIYENGRVIGYVALDSAHAHPNAFPANITFRTPKRHGSGPSYSVETLQESARCPCGGIILADTENWVEPRCVECWIALGSPAKEPEPSR